MVCKQLDKLERDFVQARAESRDPDSLEWHPHAVFHGLKRLPVRLGRDRGRLT